MMKKLKEIDAPPARIFRIGHRNRASSANDSRMLEMTQEPPDPVIRHKAILIDETQKATVCSADAEIARMTC